MKNLVYKKILSGIFSFIPFFMLSAQVQISTETQLKAIADNLSGSYVLTNDIVLTQDWVPIGQNFPFRGTLDGGHFVIRNLKMKDDTMNKAGLFAQTEGAIIKNLGIDQANVVAGTPLINGVGVGILIGTAINTTIENSHITNSRVEGRNYVGSFIGRSSMSGTLRTKIRNCYSTAIVKSNMYYAGGIIGVAQNTDIENTYFSGTAETTASITGGIIGISSGLKNTVSNCLVLSQYLLGTTVGRIVGKIGVGSLDLKNNYARADLLLGKGLLSQLKIVSDSDSYLNDLQGESIGYEAPLYSTNLTLYTDADINTAYDAFNRYYLRSDKKFYRADYNQNNVAAIWVQAIYLDMAVNAYKRNPIDKYRQLIENIYLGCYNQYDHYNWDNGTVWFIYDDIMWWTISTARAYEVTKDPKYLALAKSSFKRVWSGSTVVGDPGSYDPVTGGMFWDWDHSNPPQQSQGIGKMACINYPSVIGAMTLFNVTSDVDYLNKAKGVYKWAHENLFDSIKGRVADSRHGTNEPDWAHNWVYNQGSCIGAAMMLYKATGEKHYLEDAVIAANYVKNQLSANGILPYANHVEAGIYTAIFAPYIASLIVDGEQYQFLPWLRYNIDNGWANRNVTTNITYKNYASPTPTLSLIQSYDASGIPALMLVTKPAVENEKVVHCKSSVFYEKNLGWDLENTWIMSGQIPQLKGFAPISGLKDLPQKEEVPFNFYIQNGSLKIGTDHELQLELYNSTGVLMQKMEVNGMQKISLPKGIFVLKAEENKKVFVKKMVNN